MKTKFFVATFFLSITLFSCKQGDKKSESISTDMQKGVVHGVPDATSEAANEKTLAGPEQSPPSPVIPPIIAKHVSNPDWDKKIIRTATLKLEVKDSKEYTEKVYQTVKQFGGYIAQEDQYAANDKTETTVCIKVPVAEFESLMNQLPQGNVKITERKIAAEDVTGDYADIKTRLEARKQVRLKYSEFLKQSKNMAEVLQVQNEINAIQEEIEAAEGRVQFLSQQSAYSTINLSFFQTGAGYIPNETPSYFARLFLSFKGGALWIADLFLGIISVWPLFLILSLIFIGWKKVNKPAKIVANP